jgi:hypothetical protein
VQSLLRSVRFTNMGGIYLDTVCNKWMQSCLWRGTRTHQHAHPPPHTHTYISIYIIQLCNQSVNSFIHSFIHQWLCRPLLGPGYFISFIIFFTETVGLLGWVISPSQGRHLHTGQQKHRINAHADILGLSGIRIHDAAFELVKTIHALDRAATVIGLVRE